MSVMDEILCDHQLFGDHRGKTYQTDSLNAVLPGAKYEITATGRLELLVCDYEDHSDPNAAGFASLIGALTPVSVLRSPAVALFFAHPEDAPGIPPDSRIDVPSTEETVDSAANRAMLALIRAVARRARMLLDRLGAKVKSEQISETRTSVVERWPMRQAFLQNALQQLVTSLSTYPFNKVQNADISAAGLTAVSADPLYARAWNRGWKAIRTRMESNVSTERLWISPTWEIYERWCFLQIGKLIAASLPEYNWSCTRAPWRLTGVCQQERAELALQPRFPAKSEPSQGRWSVSREREPDLQLTVSAGGET
jgi:hypothetical protein